jgi:hypothetical protein
MCGSPQDPAAQDPVTTLQQPPQQALVTIPAGVAPGQPFLAKFNGQTLKIVAPEGSVAGGSIRIQVPSPAPPDQQQLESESGVSEYGGTVVSLPTQS